jgi:hypothetical protein
MSQCVSLAWLGCVWDERACLLRASRHDFPATVVSRSVKETKKTIIFLRLQKINPKTTKTIARKALCIAHHESPQQEAQGGNRNGFGQNGILSLCESRFCERAESV